MTTSYKKLKDGTRVWVYLSNRILNKTEVNAIKAQGEAFLRRWSAHGKKLEAALEVFHNQFIVLFADEEQAKATGCSIDKSVRFIKSLEKEFEIALLDRNLVAYKDDGRIATCTRDEILENFRRGLLKVDTVVFNNLVTTKKEFDAKWQVPFKESWLFELIER